MELYYGLIVLGLVCLSAPFWAKLAGYETHRKPFDLVGAGGVFFMLAASFQLATSMSARFAAICNPLMIVSFIIGVVGLLIGAILDGERGAPGIRPRNPRHQGKQIAVVRKRGVADCFDRPARISQLLNKPDTELSCRRRNSTVPMKCTMS